MNLKDTFGKNLKYYRYQKGYSQEKFAEKTKSDSRYISDLENGKYSASFEKIEIFAKVLEIPAYKLFEENTNHSSLPPRVDSYRVTKTKYHL